jgi:hypothetical protein
MRTDPSGFALVMTASLALIAGCAAHPISFNSVTPATGDSSYDCVLRKVNELGYTVTATNRQGRFISAAREFHKSATQAFTRQRYYDRLTVSIVDADSASRKIRITTEGTLERDNALAGQTSRAKAPTERVQADASAILTACASSPVTKEPGGAR